jgi:anti-sigma factor RsiW
MNTQPDPLQLTAFVDGELELARQLELEALMREDAGLRNQVDRLLGLREALRSRADYHAAPVALRSSVAQRLAAQATETAEVSPSAIRAGLHGWLGWRPLVAALGGAAVLAVALQFTLLPAQREQALVQEVLASHSRATLAQRLVDVESSDHHTVKPWLSSRLDFSPPVPQPQLAGTQLLGGRVDYLDGRPVAALVYRHAGHVVDAFVWPAGKGDVPVAVSSQRGFHLAHWTRRGMVHWVVSDLNAQEFAELVGALSSAE